MRISSPTFDLQHCILVDTAVVSIPKKDHGKCWYKLYHHILNYTQAEFTFGVKYAPSSALRFLSPPYKTKEINKNARYLNNDVLETECRNLEKVAGSIYKQKSGVFRGPFTFGGYLLFYTSTFLGVRLPHQPSTFSSSFFSIFAIIKG